MNIKLTTNKLEKVMETLAPLELEVIVDRDVKYRNWVVTCTSKNTYPNKETGEEYFFASSFFLKNKHSIETNIYDIAKDLWRKWRQFKKTVNMTKPVSRGEW